MSRVLTLIMICTLCVGCASSDDLPPTFNVPAGQYASAFDATRDALAELRFDLDRVDARAGVITTYAKHSAGFATPWDTEQSTLRQELEDFTNHQSRSVRVLFEPSEQSAALSDLRSYEGDLVGTVIITIERRSRPFWRVDTTGIRLSSFSRDPAGSGRRVSFPIARDPRLEGRLAKRIEHQITKSP